MAHTPNQPPQAQPVARRELAVRSVLAGLLLVLAWQIISTTAAVNLAADAPDRALHWNPWNAAALAAIAERDGIAAQGDTEDEKKIDAASKEELLERALRLNPLSVRALRDLALLRESTGDSRQAASLMTLAGQRTLRDVTAQSWLVKEALGRRDLASALPHLDALLRIYPELSNQVLPLMAVFVSYSEPAALLVRSLASEPPWRDQFLRTVASAVQDQGSVTRFYAALKQSSHPASQKEVQPYLDRLVADGAIKDAYTIWTDMIPAGRGADSNLLYNGAFATPPSGTAFDWKVAQALGADVALGPTSEDSGLLKVEFSGARVDFRNVSHLLALPPGAYHLSGEVEAEALQTRRGLRWRIFCSGHPESNLAQTDLVAESTTWRAFSASFDVPPEACEGQVLLLEIPARTALERIIAGTVSYRNMAIVPREADGGVTTGSRVER